MQAWNLHVLTPINLRPGQLIHLIDDPDNLMSIISVENSHHQLYGTAATLTVVAQRHLVVDQFRVDWYNHDSYEFLTDPP